MSALRRIIWLASFPKSGNTWLRSLLANYFQPPGTTVPINQLGQFTLSDTRQHFFDQAVGMPFQAQTVDAWIAARPKALELIAASKPGHHFVKKYDIELDKLKQAHAVELETSQFYKRMVSEVEGEGKRLFERFMEIEEGHVAIVQAEIDSIQGLGYWFDHQEFNLEGS